MTTKTKQGEKKWIKEGLKSEWKALKTPRVIFGAIAISGFALLLVNFLHLNRNAVAYTLIGLGIVLFFLTYRPKKRGGKTK